MQRFHAGQGLGAENCGQCAATIAAAGRVVTAAGELASDLNGAIQARYLPLYFTNIGIYAAQIQADLEAASAQPLPDDDDADFE